MPKSLNIPVLPTGIRAYLNSADNTFGPLAEFHAPDFNYQPLPRGTEHLTTQLCRKKLAAYPFPGCLFIFRSRRGIAIKLLVYHGQGLLSIT
jgi:hypothetical protein